MSFLNGIVTELRASKLWIAAVALIGVLIAIPALLSSSPAAPAPLSTPTPSPQAIAAAVPVLSTDPSPSAQAVVGGGRDPFTPQSGAAKPKSVTASAVAKAVTSLVSKVASESGGSSAPKGSSSGGSSVTDTSSTSGSSDPFANIGAPVSRPLHRVPGGSSGPGHRVTTHRPGPKSTGTNAGNTGNTGSGGNTGVPAPAPLGAKQAYVVAVSTSTSGGSVQAVDPLLRGSALPNTQTPGLIELGVLPGGTQVAFAVASDATVSGPGTCVPGPSDCEVLELPIDTTGTPETVSIAVPGATAPLEQELTVTDIRRQSFATVAAAAKARGTTDRSGELVLAGWTQPALTLFAWNNAQGYLVDERNLNVGGGS